MTESANPYRATTFAIAADAAVDERSDFITKTYVHLVGAIVTLVALEFALLQTGIGEQFVQLLGKSPYGWLIVLGAFMAVSWIANRWASSSTSLPMQYAGLGLYVVAQAFLLLPLLWMANRIDTGIIPAAGLGTVALFVALTAVVFITRKDFSFLRSILMFGGFAALGLIVCAIVFQFSLGPIFTYAMIAFACGYILYDTSNILHHYRIGQHVAASLALFASVALLFWYVLRLVMAARD